jgi:hypothetical protein
LGGAPLPPPLLTSGQTGEGVPEIWAAILEALDALPQSPAEAAP